MVEYCDMIVDSEGKVLSQEISGEIVAECKVPEKPTVYAKVRLDRDLEDLALHP